MPRRPLMTYRARHELPVPPADVWETMQEVDQFERWWPWLQDFTCEGGSLRAGAVLRGVVAPPLPYRMRLEVTLTRCEARRTIDASVHGDLVGEASLELCPRGAFTDVDVGWTLEMMQAPMRLADRFAHPLMQWGHDRVVESTIAGFRKRLTSTG